MKNGIPGFPGIQHTCAVYALTDAHVLSTCAATGFEPRPGLTAQQSVRNNFAPPSCLPWLRFCAWNQKIVPWNWQSISLVLPFPPCTRFSWLCESWRLCLLACPHRSRATDFTHFYWLIWLCSCQQLRASQESEILRDSTSVTASIAAVWLSVPAGSGIGEKCSYLSHNKWLTVLDWGMQGLRNCLWD